jgi:hypothetical protein
MLRGGGAFGPGVVASGALVTGPVGAAGSASVAAGELVPPKLMRSAQARRVAVIDKAAMNWAVRAARSVARLKRKLILTSSSES